MPIMECYVVSWVLLLLLWVPHPLNAFLRKFIGGGYTEFRLCFWKVMLTLMMLHAPHQNLWACLWCSAFPNKGTMQFSWLNFAEICFHCLSCLLHAAKLECLVLVMILVTVITCMLFALSIYLSAFILLVFEGRIGKAICYLYFSSLYLAFILFSLCFHRNGRINQGIWEMGKKGVRDKATYKSFKEKTEVSFFVFFFSELPFLLPLW